jgi:hypothetical protein
MAERSWSEALPLRQTFFFEKQKQKTFYWLGFGFAGWPAAGF